MVHFTWWQCARPTVQNAASFDGGTQNYSASQFCMPFMHAFAPACIVAKPNTTLFTTTLSALPAVLYLLRSVQLTLVSATNAASKGDPKRRPTEEKRERFEPPGPTTTYGTANVYCYWSSSEQPPCTQQQ